MMSETDPTAPDSLPKYLAEELPNQDRATLSDVIEYAEALIEERQQPVTAAELEAADYLGKA